MQRELAQDIPMGEARVKFLKDNCDKVEQKSYMKRFTPDQLSEMKEELSETAIKINDIEELKKAALAKIKEEIDPLLDEKKRLLVGLKNKAENVTENCFKFTDVENRMVGFYNEEGLLIDSRPAYADELQTNIFQLQRTGTNN